MTKQLCRDCKHLETDGMFGIFCGVGGDNTKYDCPRYAKRSDRMTEYFKKFTMAKDEVTVIDFGENEVFECKYSDEAKSLCNVLNDLDYEKYNLKKENEQLKEENHKLKQYIYDNIDEDICDVCSYQYLEKSQMDKYYVAKCEKGYDNCSKGTVIHCEDFEFKELQE